MKRIARLRALHSRLKERKEYLGHDIWFGGFAAMQITERTANKDVDPTDYDIYAIKLRDDPWDAARAKTDNQSVRNFAVSIKNEKYKIQHIKKNPASFSFEKLPLLMQILDREGQAELELMQMQQACLHAAMGAHSYKTRADFKYILAAYDFAHIPSLVSFNKDGECISANASDLMPEHLGWTRRQKQWMRFTRESALSIYQRAKKASPDCFDSEKQAEEAEGIVKTFMCHSVMVLNRLYKYIKQERFELETDSETWEEARLLSEMFLRNNIFPIVDEADPLNILKAAGSDTKPAPSYTLIKEVLDFFTE